VVYVRPLREGQPLTFGVSGMLWRASLIMFDRESGSLWSHVKGRAVSGPLEGHRLRMLPALHTTWALWRATHPGTLVLDKRGGGTPSRPLPSEDRHALGIVVAGQAAGFPFEELRRTPLAHHEVGGQPVLVVYVESAATAVAFGRRVAGRTLTFHRLAAEGDGWRMEDRETGSRWNAVTGEAQAGSLSGQILPSLPATQAYLSAWRTLYPRGTMWRTGDAPSPSPGDRR
jgi:hypothetical protein